MQILKRANGIKQIRLVSCSLVVLGFTLVMPLTAAFAQVVTEEKAQVQKRTQARGQEPTSQMKPAFDPKAEQLLRKMSDYLARRPTLSFNANSSTEVVTKDGQKLEFDADSQVALERPNKLRSERKGELADVILAYDGKEVTLYGKGTNYYAKTKAPATLDEAIDFTRNRLGIEAPAADLLSSQAYAKLKEDVYSGKYIGKVRVNGVETHHLAFRGTEADWQIWIADGPRPLPMKYLITSKNVEQAPEFTVVLRDWDIAPRFDPGYFTLKVPADAMRIAFAADIMHPASEMRKPASETK